MASSGIRKYFVFFLSCNFQMINPGSIAKMRSVITAVMLYEIVREIATLRSMHFPGWYLSQAKDIGWHWNIEMKKKRAPEIVEQTIVI